MAVRALRCLGTQVERLESGGHLQFGGWNDLEDTHSLTYVAPELHDQRVHSARTPKNVFPVA